MKNSEWVKSKISLTTDQLIIADLQVMQKWEKEYMKMLVEIATKNGNSILEVGYGMGIAASFIQKTKIKKHTIIEAHPLVYQHAKKMLQSEIKRKKIELLNGFWQDIVKTLKDESFDGILFDTFPLKMEKKKNYYFLKK